MMDKINISVPVVMIGLCILVSTNSLFGSGSSSPADSGRKEQSAAKLIRHLEDMNVYEDKKVLARMEQMILDQPKMSGKKGVGR